MNDNNDPAIDWTGILIFYGTPVVIVIIAIIAGLIVRAVNAPTTNTNRNESSWSQEEELNRQIDNEEYNRALYEYQECMEEASEYYVPKCYKPTQPRH